ncbi:MAG: excinuclease subunit [Candidatus Berkelbacteria bacterium]|nr:excinuclease subunit [Candidatus Berkelbacteria bacterium]
MSKKYYVYIATNKSNTLYTGVTNDIQRRMYEHKFKFIKGFTEKYNINKLVYFQEFNNPNEAITVEKKIKGWTRAKKINLIKSLNPTFKDLLESC